MKSIFILCLKENKDKKSAVFLKAESCCFLLILSFEAFDEIGKDIIYNVLGFD